MRQYSSIGYADQYIGNQLNSLNVFKHSTLFFSSDLLEVFSHGRLCHRNKRAVKNIFQN